MPYKNKYDINDIVYEPFAPLNPGKVLAVFPTSNIGWQWEYDVKFLKDGKIRRVYLIKDFKALIADHQKKVNTHTNNLKKIEEL